jgi:isopentenyl-diphosphate delta-isomerase
VAADDEGGPEVNLVDEDGRLVGTASKRAAHVAPAPLHSAVSVVVLEPDGARLLLQRRAAAKYHFGDRWSNAACTHPTPGETEENAVRRCVAAELATTTHRVVRAGTFVYRAADRRTGLEEHERDTVFVAFVDGPPRAVAGEVDALEWCSAEAVGALLRDEAPACTPWLGLVLRAAAAASPVLLPFAGAPPSTHPDLLTFRSVPRSPSVDGPAGGAVAPWEPPGR